MSRSIDPKQHLTGQTVLLTRPLAQAEALIQRIEEASGKVLHLPMLDLLPLSDRQSQDIKNHLKNLSCVEIAIFISVNAVRFTAEYFRKAGVCLPPGSVCLGIGAATAQEIQRQRWQLGEVPVVESSNGLLSLPILQNVQAKTVAVFKGVGGLHTIEDQLSARGAQVKTIALYRRSKPEYKVFYVKQQFASNRPSVAIFASGETLENFISYAKSEDFFSDFQKLPIIVPSKRVAELAEAAACKNIFIAKSAGVQSMMEALMQLKCLN